MISPIHLTISGCAGHLVLYGKVPPLSLQPMFPSFQLPSITRLSCSRCFHYLMYYIFLILSQKVTDLINGVESCAADDSPFNTKVFAAVAQLPDTFRQNRTIYINLATTRQQPEDFNIKWTIICRARPYSNITKTCDLPTTEKLMIINSKPDELLNKRSELISKCCNESKFQLKNN